MADREKVIKALRVCYAPAVISCMYRDRGQCDYDSSYCQMELFRDAAELLEAQEPCVMTLEDVKALPGDSEGNTPVWIETRIVTDNGVLTYLEASILWMFEDGLWQSFRSVYSSWETMKADSYAVTWRVWTAKPSDELREATKWLS